MIINILMLIAGLVLAFWFIGNALGFLMMLLVAGLVGFAAEAMVPNGDRGVHGWLGAMGAGLLGSWLGPVVVGHVGPVLMGVQIVPALVGALILVAVLSFVRRANSRA